MKFVLAINMEKLMSHLFLFVHTFIFSFPHMFLTEIQVQYFHSLLQEFQCCSIQYHREIIVDNRILGLKV